MSIEIKSLPFEIKSVDVEKRSFTGLVAAFNNIDAGQDIYARGAFTDQLAFFVKNGVVRDEHGVTTGKITSAKETDAGLEISGQISPTQAGKEQAILLNDGVYQFLSIGAKNQGKYLNSPDEIKSFWLAAGYTPSAEDLDRAEHGARLITKAKPYEASTTFIPMNEKTAIYSVKSAAGPAGRKLTQHLQDTLEVLEGATQRVASVATLRGESARELSLQTKSLVGRLHAAAGQLQTALAGIPATAETPATAPETPTAAPPMNVEALRLYSEFQSSLLPLPAPASS